MDIYPKNISPLGYQTGVGGIDSYGVNHNGFTNQDEIAYQMARSSREQNLIKQYNAQGITSNYPQYTTNFWGNNAENNYGFGSSNIENNITNVLNPMSNNLNKGVQYAQNNLSSMASDVNQTSKMIDYSLYGNDFSKEFKANFIRNVHSVEDKYLQKDPSQKVFEQGHRNRFNQY